MAAQVTTSPSGDGLPLVPRSRVGAIPRRSTLSDQPLMFSRGPEAGWNRREGSAAVPGQKSGFETNWFDQSIPAIGGSRIDKYNSYDRTLRRINGPNPNVTAAENQFNERRYWRGHLDPDRARLRRFLNPKHIGGTTSWTTSVSSTTMRKADLLWTGRSRSWSRSLRDG